MRKILFAAILAVPLGAASVAMAQTAPPAASPTAPPAQMQKLTETEIHQGLKAEGYTDIKTLKSTGDEVQLEAKKGGKTVMLVVDARTGRYKESAS
ncbi:MAG: PepSY domain-containing protein [Alphaproteobacteria bacterium]